MEQWRQNLDWHKLLWEKHNLEFLAEVGLRTFISFVALLITLRFLGRRSVQQLSVFELVLVLTLSTAAGDVTFKDDTPVIPALSVLLFIAIFYRITTWIAKKSRIAEQVVEGSPIELIRNGVFVVENLNHNNMNIDELLMELRLKSVEHVGQVRLAIGETSGELSIYFYSNEEIKPGLSVLPHTFENDFQEIESHGTYSCSRCGYTEILDPASKVICSNCKNDRWIVSLCKTRNV